MTQARTVEPSSRRLSSYVPWLILAGVVALLLASVRGGDGRQGAAGQPLEPSAAPVAGRVTVWSWNVAAKSLRALLPAFAERHPGVDVDVVMNGTQVQTRFLLSLSAGTGAPDVMQLQGYETPRYTATGRLTDLTAVAAKYEKMFPAAAWANCVHDGKVYAIPWDIGPCAVFYKPEVLAKYGVDPDGIETWDDFIDAGKQVLERSRGKTKMLPLGRNSLQMMHEMLLQQVGGQVFDDQGQVVVDSPASLQAMQLIRRMLDAGICANVDLFTHEWMAGLAADTIACYPGAVWLGGTIKDTAGDYAGRSQWRVFRLPAFERGGPRVANMGGSVLVIPDQSPNKAAAWAFVEFVLCVKESQVAQYANFDLFPGFLPALQDPFFQQPDAFYGGQRVRALFAEGVERLPVLNRTTDWVEASDYLNQGFTGWAAGGGDPAAALETMAGKLSRRLGRERATTPTMLQTASEQGATR